MNEVNVEEVVTQVSVGVVEKNESVVLVFDKEISWLSIDPVQALKIAEQMKSVAVGILRSQPMSN